MSVFTHGKSKEAYRPLPRQCLECDLRAACLLELREQPTKVDFRWGAVIDPPVVESVTFTAHSPSRCDFERSDQDREKVEVFFAERYPGVRVIFYDDAPDQTYIFGPA